MVEQGVVLKINKKNWNFLGKVVRNSSKYKKACENKASSYFDQNLTTFHRIFNKFIFFVNSNQCFNNTPNLVLFRYSHAKIEL